MLGGGADASSQGVREWVFVLAYLLEGFGLGANPERCLGDRQGGGICGGWVWVGLGFGRGFAGTMGMRGMWTLRNLEVKGRYTRRYLSCVFSFARGILNGAKSTIFPFGAECLER